ncbi:MAG TPA: FAD-binding protein [Candidatus Diapherotrites archaeon]|uniref:FAD-binding protein n=1 Tax=Candidatus Iainarchaeum sp. TaxID=3101447 RepID=A0A7J4K0X8_9ARCH|nr:FAD-binding protein [Candidatus Diapherotrites archaeon]
MGEANFDIAIVGAGPAGLFAALELVSKKPGLKVALIDKGASIKNRQKSEVMCGIGGSGTWSDGKLHFSPVLSHEKILDFFPVSEYQKIMDSVEQTFLDFGVDAEVYPKNWEKVQELVEECKRKNIHLVPRKLRHVGSDKLPKVIENFENFLREKNVKILEKTEVTDIIDGKKCSGVILSDGSKILAKSVILAPGRIGTKWLQDVARKHGIAFEFETVEIGVRVEFPAEIMKRFAELMYEAIFVIQTPSYDDFVRTFCPCPNGMVSTEQYDGFVCVNGHSNSSHLSENSNFAFVSKVRLTEPVENTTAYARSIAQLATTIGGGKPIIQRLTDFKKHRRSTWERINKCLTKPTLTDVTPGDIAMALPARVVQNLREGLEALDKVMPGIDSDNTLLYAPEVKLRSSKIQTSKSLETKIENLFVAGDGAGVSGNIVGAAATGIIAARGVLEKVG